MFEKKPVMKAFTVLFFLMAVQILSAQAELKPRISVFPLENPSKDVQVDIISRNVQKTIELNLKMIDKYIIVENSVTEYSSDKNWLLDYCAKNNIDDIIFGRALIGEASGTVFLEMSVFNRQKGDVTLNKSELAETFFDIFEVSDLLAVAMMEGFSGMHLGFGSVKFTNSGDNGAYEVYIDDVLAGESLSSLPTVLNGERQVRITQKRMFDELELYNDKITVLEKKTAEVTFTIPGFLEDEEEALEKQESYIDKNWDKKYSSKKVDKRFERLLKLLEAPQYSATAVEKKKAVDEKLALWQAKKDEWGITTGISILDRKGGAALFTGASLMFPDYTEEGSPGWEPGMTLNPKLGASLSYNLLGNIALQAEAVFMHVWAEIENNNILLTQGVEFNMLEFPVLLLYRTPGKVLSVYGGANYQQRLNDGRIYMEMPDYEMDQDGGDEFFENSGLSAIAGMLFEFPLKRNFLRFDFRYSRGLTNWVPDQENENSSTNLYLDYFHVTVGYGLKFF